MSDVYGCVTNCNALSPALIDFQSSDDEICSTAIFCGVAESLRSVIWPRTPNRCWSGSTWMLRSKLLNVNASRSSAKAFAAKTHNTQSKPALAQRILIPQNFILYWMRLRARGAVARSHKELRQ